MPRLRLIPAITIALALCAHAAPPAEQIFPDSTNGFFSIKSLEEFGEQWGKTQFGQLMNDPLMNDFKAEVRKQLTENMENTFGLTLDGISSLPTGELALGMIAIPNKNPGYALTMDIAGKRSETDNYLADLSQKLSAAKVQKTTETYRGKQITVLTFPQPEVSRPIRSARVEIAIEPAERKAYYMFWDDVLVASDQLHLLQLMADRLAGQSTAMALADVAAYQVVMKRCIGDMPDGTSPVLRWYVEPLAYGESVRTVLQSRNPSARSRQNRISIFGILKEQGFDAIRGIGGVVSVQAEEQESVYRTFIHTQKPYRLAMRMLDFPNNTNFTPPTWMPGDLARCTMLNVDPLAIFDNVGVLFDALVMPGEEGLWKEIFYNLKNDPHGPMIDVREELVVHLGNRILGMSRYEKPITVKSECMVVAVELKAGQEQAMLAGIEKLFGKDPEMEAVMHKSYKIWHRKPIVVRGPISDEDLGIPSIFGDKNGTNVEAVQEATDAADDKPPMFPEGGIVVAKEYLFVSTNIEYLKVILDRLGEVVESSIAGESEYKSVQQIFSGLGLVDKPHFFQFFARTHETLRPTYEMIRLDQMARSQAILAKILNEFLSPEEESGVRRQIIDGSTLPKFDQIQHYFGTVGIYGVTEEEGYFIKGFAVKRE